METKAQIRAMDNLVHSIDISARLPRRVFSEKYAEIYVMDWRNLIHRTAVNISRVLMEDEGSSVVVIGRFDRPNEEPQDWRQDAFFVSASTEPEEYHSFITRNLASYGLSHAPPEIRQPWGPYAQRIGASSDLGTWSIYGEMCAEIAVLGFKVRTTDRQEETLFRKFRIEKLASALKRDTFFGEPDNEYSKRQRSILRSEYLSETRGTKNGIG